jgi:putative transport protein
VRHTGNGATSVATDETRLHGGDVLLAVGTRRGLEQFARVVGRASAEDLMKAPGQVTARRVVVTDKAALGRSLRELALRQRHGVTLTRVTRGDLEMVAGPELRLRFGDVVQVVGEPDDVAAATAMLGDSLKKLNETQFIPLFIGIALGVTIGLIPIPLPGMSAPVRLGLAGGPLIVGIVLSRLGHIRGLVWHMPLPANLAFRELGITLFLAAVGLTAGERFFTTVLTRTGLLWLLCAVLVATVPLLLVGAIARAAMNMNYTTISGLIAGSTTDPPALAFAGLLAQSEGPHLAYATVYPLTMLLRIVAAQGLVMLLCR